jgi:hypothetical protein
MTKEEKKLQCIEQIDTEIERIRKSLYDNLNKLLKSGAIPEHYFDINYNAMLTNAVLYCTFRDRNYKAWDKKEQKEFNNLHLFM